MKGKSRYKAYYHSPIGDLLLGSDGECLTGLWMDGQKYYASNLLPLSELKEELPVFALTFRWLDLYFSSSLPDFRPPICWNDTDFRCLVWTKLLAIPYGCTTTYGELARQIALEKNLPHFSAQAVGNAVGRNPISIIVPCHRVVGGRSQLTGYAGGLERKQFLLSLENKLK